MKSSSPAVRDLVLIGGGHSHAIALKLLGMNPIPGWRITLISDVYHTPYSGMLPGYVAGLYTFDDCHIDLRLLANFAQARLFADRAIGLDLDHQTVICEHHPPVAYDLLSIDIGSTPTAVQVPGAIEYAIAVKPISKFLTYWETLVDHVKRSPHPPLSLGVVGGGAGGVELALSLQARLQAIYHDAGYSLDQLELHLFHRGVELLPERHPSVRRKMHRLFAQRGIHLHLQENVIAIKADGDNTPRLVMCESGLTVQCDRVFWVTQASAASWIRDSQLATDSRGFIQINDRLQSVSHAHVFAAGDIATMVNHPRPKAGVFAVRQGEPLVQNLRRAALGQPLQPFVPQDKFLILIGTGTGRAIASRGAFTIGPSRLIWWWKDHIDRQFMQRFSDLQPMNATHSSSQSGEADQPQAMPCAGCGAKVGASVLASTLSRIKQHQPDWGDRPDILIGLDAPDDASAIRVPSGQALVQTLDYFPALIDDPFIFGQIATHHCLSDIFAMGATPHSALAIATLPQASPSIMEETLYQLLSGSIKVLHQAHAPLIGGHTIAGNTLVFGLSCNGLASPSQLLRKQGMQPDNVIILTKALGIGTLFAADMRLQAKGRWIEGAIASMLQSNHDAAQCLRQHQATACTDITGFGLIGHLSEMLDGTSNRVELNLQTIPLLDGAPEALQRGIVSSLQPQNLSAARFIQNLDAIAKHPLFPILFDPQTSGGLLATIPGDRAQACLTALHALGYSGSRIIGRVLPLGNKGQPIIVNI
jgi:selenide,water dikinase